MEKCGGKRIYESERAAKQVRTAIYKARSPKLRIYWCDECCGWHLTSISKAFETPPRKPSIQIEADE